MLAFRQFGVGCHVVNIAVKLVRGFHFHRGTTLNMFLVEGTCSISKCRCLCRMNQRVSLENGSFSVDQFYSSVVCMREIEVVCIVHSCSRFLLLMRIVMWCEQC